MNFQDISLKIEHLDMGFINIVMVLNMMENGMLILKMVLVKKAGVMVLSTVDYMLKAENKGWEVINGPMEVNMMVNGMTIAFMDM